MNLLLSRGRHHRTEIFDALVDDMNQVGVDHIVVTGDITNIALRGEFEFARERFDRIAIGPGETTVIPGNHDAYVAQGAEFFTRYFDPFHVPDDGWDFVSQDNSQTPGPVARWPIVRVRGPVAVIGLSTSLQTPWFTAYGVVGDSQLERLESALTDERLADKFRIVAIHHPPAGPPSVSRIRGLRDRLQLAAVLAKVGAELVLHGHEHRDLINYLPGPDGQPIPVRGIPSASYEAGDPGRRARYRIYEIERSAAGGRPTVVGETVRIWDPLTGQAGADPDGPAEPTQKANDYDNLTPDRTIGYDATKGG
jgi:3',5'-cyclic AMP phosphodiesterase CpdA